MDLQYLRYFYEVARCKSFTGAARALRVSQPSISKIVKLLEHRQGVKLFDRGKRNVALTEEGQIFFESCRRIFGEVEDLDRRVKNLRSEDVGEVSLAVSDNVANHLLPNVLLALRAKYPGITLRLATGFAEFIKAELRDGRAEVGMFFAQTKEPEFEVTRVGTVEFVVVVAKKIVTRQHLSSGRLSVSILANLGFVGSRASDYRGPYPVLSMLKELGIEAHPVVECTSQEVQKQMAKAGIGFTVVPRFMVENELRNKELLEVSVPRPISHNLQLLRLKHRTPSRAALRVIQFMEKELRSALK